MDEGYEEVIIEEVMFGEGTSVSQMAVEFEGVVIAELLSDVVSSTA